MNSQRAAKHTSGRAMPVVAIAAALVVPPSMTAATRFADAKAIVQEAQKRTETKSQRYDGILKSYDAAGKMVEKRWSYERLGSHGQSKSIIRFTAPAEVKGVALFVVNHPDRDSDQWMWTPAIERDRRVASQDRSTRFFGTDFTFEDLEERDVNQYDYSSLEDETLDGAKCWVVQFTAKESKSSQYTKSVMWIRQDNYVAVRLDLFTKEGMVKRQSYGNIRNIQGIWTPLDTTMADLRRKTQTQLVLERVQYNVPFKEENFTLQALRR